MWRTVAFSCIVNLLCGLVLASCLTFPLKSTQDNIVQIQYMHKERIASCTAWAVSPYRWITVSHCVPTDGVVYIADMPLTLISTDEQADVAMFSGGPRVRPLRVASSRPPVGSEVYIYGYGVGQPVLLFFRGNVISHTEPFFDNIPGPVMLLGSANGMPGMSGGPVLFRDTVIGVVTGGGDPADSRQLLGIAVSWDSLVAFIKSTREK